MSLATLPVRVHVVERRSEFYIADAPAPSSGRERWRRMSAREEARGRTGVDSSTGEVSVAIFVERRPNDRPVIGFDLFRTGLLQLTDETIRRLEKLWSEDVAQLPAAVQRRLSRKAHFSCSFVEVPTERDRVAEWTRELEQVLLNPRSYVEAA
jgi:hypothetical protein